MNTNRRKKVVEVKNIKTDTNEKVRFKNKTTVGNTIFEKDVEYSIDSNIIKSVRNFIY